MFVLKLLFLYAKQCTLEPIAAESAPAFAGRLIMLGIFMYCFAAAPFFHFLNTNILVFFAPFNLQSS